MTITVEKAMDYDKDKANDVVCWLCEESVKQGSWLENGFRAEHDKCFEQHEREAEERYAAP